MRGPPVSLLSAEVLFSRLSSSKAVCSLINLETIEKSEPEPTQQAVVVTVSHGVVV